jgi:hypothetical protein
MILPQEAKEKLATEFRSAEGVTNQISDGADSHEDIFSFDLPDDSPSAPVQGNDDPFNFDMPPTKVKQPGKSQSEDDVFADLLESTSQSDESPFAGTQTANPPVAVKHADSSSAPGEFDLESFSWDDTPSGTAESDGTEATDDFDSLFGETKKNTQK